MTPLLPTWRWFGPGQPDPAPHVRHTGATGAVTALHHLPPGVAWSADETAERKALIGAAGLVWAVVESVPVSDAIWRDAHLAAWTETPHALGPAGVRTVCCNVMPVLDWTRADLATTGRWRRASIPSTSPPGTSAASGARTPVGPTPRARRRAIAGARGRPNGARRWSTRPSRVSPAPAGVTRGAGSGRGSTSTPGLGKACARASVRLAIHADDALVPLFGLPRVVSMAADLAAVLEAAPQPRLGLTLCPASPGARVDNDLPDLARRHAGRVHFAHLRNVRREAGRAFHEAEPLEGSAPMIPVIAAPMAESARRGEPIPFRPDHGPIIGPDEAARMNPGYSFAGAGAAWASGAMRALAANT